MTKIYTIFNGKLFSVEARKTKKFFVLKERQREFGWYKIIPKKDACVTPRQAIQREKNILLTAIGSFEDALKNHRDKFANIEKLESHFKDTNTETDQTTVE
jgi:PIN domain nuclease of toxin-antitoxin system